MSPSAYLRGHGNGIFFVREYLRHLKEIGVEVINGYDAYLVETSKATQLGIYEALGIRYRLGAGSANSGSGLTRGETFVAGD
jgi:hypothetical protein